MRSWRRGYRVRTEFEIVKPMDIEKRSFEIISEELRKMGKILAPETEMIVKRCIHTSADFDYADSLVFSEGVTGKALEALREGTDIVTDTQMARSGINRRAAERLGSDVLCFMSDGDVAKRARELGMTRAAVSMDKAAELSRERGGLIYAIGNAPTALIRLCEQIRSGLIAPRLVIGVPVGFVNVVQAKELLLSSDVPYIVAKGRKGGSSIAACICNALLYMIDNDRS